MVERPPAVPSDVGADADAPTAEAATRATVGACQSCGALWTGEGRCRRCGGSVVSLRPAHRGSSASIDATRLAPLTASQLLKSGQAAGFWIRFFASFIDWIALSAASTALSLLLGSGAGAVFAVLGVTLLYLILAGAGGQSLGKAVLGIKIVTFDTGEPPGLGRALIRHVVSIFSAIVLFLGYFSMLGDYDKRTWHDKAAGVRVVYI